MFVSFVCGPGLSTCAGIYSFKQGNKQLSQKLMRGRVAAQGFTVLVMTAGLYMAGPPQVRVCSREQLQAVLNSVGRSDSALN